MKNVAAGADTLRIGVRALAEYVHRTGGLSPVGFSSLTAIEGTRAHQRFFKAYSIDPDKVSIQTEVALEGLYHGDGLTMMVNGRADAIIHDCEADIETIRIVEAKAVSGPIDAMQQGGDGVHWAQAMLYGYLYALANTEAVIDRISLFYLSVESNDAIEFDREVSRTELAGFFEKTCKAYARWAADLQHYRIVRDHSALAVRFPYTRVRHGQKPFMRQVLSAVHQRSAMLIQAPTGIGKTMSAIYPAVKAIAHHLTDNVFYLTAKSSTRAAAEKALEDLRDAGLIMKSITLHAKESVCPVPDIYCDPRQCPYATGYYERIHAALDRLMSLPAVLRPHLAACAEEFKVCPFELSLDFSLYCDLIICDYNYVFDPRVRLIRYFDESSGARRLLLVDEAHNLPDRAREMYSAELTEASFRDAAAVLDGLHAGMDRSLAVLASHFNAVTAGLGSEQPFLDLLEEGVAPAEVLLAQAFRATRLSPGRLCGRLWRFVHQCQEILDEIPAGKVKRKVLEFFFSALFFLKVVEEYYDATYVTTYTLAGGKSAVRLLCLDASSRLAACYRNRYPIIFFSATLSPLRYFERMLAGRNSSGLIVSLVLPSPFPPENLLVCIVGTVSTRFRDRRDTVYQVAALIDAAVSAKTGNYLVFLPSFEYLRQVHSAFMGVKSREAGPERVVQTQTPNMSDAHRSRYLESFSRYGDRTLVSFAVLGGVFGEGIDLAGDRLSGVIIIGTGLPMFCPEREIMKEYYQDTMDGGFEYAYMYPGFNKVQQAAGRVIRSDEDRGFVVLVDDRYLRPEYAELLPEDWNPHYVQDAAELSETIRSFG
ncbi:MAG TPA: ATP-dependent DNA helicase [Clostridia bacterium]